MPREACLALPNYAGDLSKTSLPEYQVIRHIVMPSVTKFTPRQARIVPVFGSVARIESPASGLLRRYAVGELIDVKYTVVVSKNLGVAD